MTPPTFQQVLDYSRSIGYTDLDPQAFILYYSNRNWELPCAGGRWKKMTSWKIAVQTWFHKWKKEQDLKVQKAQVVLAGEEVRNKLLAGRGVSVYEKYKLSGERQRCLEERSDKLWYLMDKYLKKE